MIRALAIATMLVLTILPAVPAASAATMPSKEVCLWLRLSPPGAGLTADCWVRFARWTAFSTCMALLEPLGKAKVCYGLG